MKNISVAIAVLLIAPFGTAHARFREGDGCFVDTYMTNTFYFCGREMSSCDGKNAKHWQDIYTYNDGRRFEYNGIKYWCCAKDPGSVGKFMAGESWLVVDDKAAVKDLGNGATCTYNKQVTICGDDISIECNTPDSCKYGQVLRNNECITPCSDGYAYESIDSNVCVSCPTAGYRASIDMVRDNGVVRPRSVGVEKENVEALGRICIRCDETKQFVDTARATCVNKKDSTQYSKDVMKKCFACPATLFKDCVEVFSKLKPSAESNYADIVKSCMIKDK